MSREKADELVKHLQDPNSWLLTKGLAWDCVILSLSLLQFHMLLRLFEWTFFVSKRNTSEYPRCHSVVDLVASRVWYSIGIGFQKIPIFFKSTSLV